MKPIIFAALLAFANGALCQNLALPEPMPAAPQARSSAPADAPESRMMVEESDGEDFRHWYARQNRPAVVLYFNRELDQLPPGWEGASRVLIEDSFSDGKYEDKRTVTVGVERNTQSRTRSRSQFARLFEQSLSVELKKQALRLLDSTILHRKLAANKQKRATDIEYESLSGAARFVLEVELVLLNDEVEVVANMKDLRSGEIAASVRQKVEGLNSNAEIDRVNRALVKRLMRYKVG
jgi:hypothetical protein